jgi:carbon monoxide dehydrogenase subunit G
MRLSFSGSPEVSAPRTVVWQRLLDAEFVAASAPGVERVERIDDSHFRVVSAVGVGAIKFQFTLEVELLELKPPEHLVMRAHGKAPGSTVDVAATIDLVETAPGRTTMRWQSECDVGGMLASIGGRLLDGMAGKLTEQFWQDFARRAGAAAAA